MTLSSVGRQKDETNNKSHEFRRVSIDFVAHFHWFAFLPYFEMRLKINPSLLDDNNLK